MKGNREKGVGELNFKVVYYNVQNTSVGLEKT